MEQKRSEARKERWNVRFFKVVPAIDEDGNPLKQDPPINKEGFWEKPNPGLSLPEAKDVKRKR